MFIHQFNIVAVILIIISYQVQECPSGILIRTNSRFFKVYLCFVMIYIIPEDKTSICSLYLTCPIEQSQPVCRIRFQSVRCYLQETYIVQNCTIYRILILLICVLCLASDVPPSAVSIFIIFSASLTARLLHAYT